MIAAPKDSRTSQCFLLVVSTKIFTCKCIWERANAARREACYEPPSYHLPSQMRAKSTRSEPVPHMSENADATVRSARSSIASSDERPRNFSHGVLQKLRRNGGGAYETLAEIYKSKPGIQLNERNSWRFMQKHLTLCALIRQSRRAKKEENRLFAEASWKCIYNPRPS